MNNNYTLTSAELVRKIANDKGYYFIETEKWYGEDYVGPELIIATDDINFKEKYPKLAKMLIIPVEKFIELAEVVNESVRNDMREDKRWERHHNEEGYYEEISDYDEDRIAPLAIKDQPLDPVADSVEYSIIREQLLAAMNNLNEQVRRRVYAYYYEGLSYREIAEREGVGDKTIRQSISGGTKKLKKFLKTPPSKGLSLSLYIRGV